MRILPVVAPTAEQLAILGEYRPGFLLVRGAAGSGKTTTALLRLRQLCSSRLARRSRLGHTAPVRVLVLTYNRTLSGYIAKLAEDSVVQSDGLELQVSTFGKWASSLLSYPEIIEGNDVKAALRPHISRIPLDPEFLFEEVDYVLGRFQPHDLPSYIGARRGGRGIAPRVEAPLRRQILDEVIAPYSQYKRTVGVYDWNDVAFLAGQVKSTPWDIVIVDEAQDFSANQARTIVDHLADDFNATFVIDATQRIYPRYFMWSEAGVTGYRTRKLENNYRNTRQIAAFARPLVAGLPIDDDGSLPNFESCERDGPHPVVVEGTYSAQIKYALNFIRTSVNLEHESVAFLQPKGGGWFDALREHLTRGELRYCDLTRKSYWPTGPEAIALSTLYSAKGLEFDHVVIPGLNQQVTPHGIEEGDSQFEALRRLVAMGVGRARKTVHLGYKSGEASSIVSLLEPSTFAKVVV